MPVNLPHPMVLEERCIAVGIGIELERLDEDWMAWIISQNHRLTTLDPPKHRRMISE